MNEKFYLMSFLLMDIHVKQMQGMTITQLEAHIKDAMDLVDRVYEAGKERGWIEASFLERRMKPVDAIGDMALPEVKISRQIPSIK